MSHYFAWAKRPMVSRIHELRMDVPVTMIYGSKSWVDSKPSEVVKERITNFHTHVRYNLIYLISLKCFYELKNDSQFITFS